MSIIDNLPSPAFVLEERLLRKNLELIPDRPPLAATKQRDAARDEGKGERVWACEGVRFIRGYPIAKPDKIAAKLPRKHYF